MGWLWTSDSKDSSKNTPVFTTLSYLPFVYSLTSSQSVNPPPYSPYATAEGPSQPSNSTTTQPSSQIPQSPEEKLRFGKRVVYPQAVPEQANPAIAPVLATAPEQQRGNGHRRGGFCGGRGMMMRGRGRGGWGRGCGRRENKQETEGAGVGNMKLEGNSAV
jgi:hypothetical protein